MLEVREPDTNDRPTVIAIASNAELMVEPDERIVTGTLEYTEGSDASPYFIPSSLCD